MMRRRSVSARVEEHREATRRFADSVRSLPTGAWSRSRGDGRWSPAEVTEHLSLAFDAAVRQMAGGERMAPRAGTVMQALLRWFLLPHIVFHRSFPLRARAPREIRPTSSDSDPGSAMDRFAAKAEAFEAAIAELAARERRRTLEHPYFGRITPLQMLRFSTAHVEHHRRQLERAGR
jgi:uncharacterized damage-inducible protein DinB